MSQCERRFSFRMQQPPLGIMGRGGQAIFLGFTATTDRLEHVRQFGGGRDVGFGDGAEVELGAQGCGQTQHQEQQG